MAEFLTTSGTSYQIENIIRNAKSKLVLVSPYLQLSKTLFERLKDADKRGVSIYLIYGKDELKPNEKVSLAELNDLKLHYFDNLHAKCYYNESSMVITSMNMYEFSEKTNREMGVFLTSYNDKIIYSKAVDEVYSIIESATVIPLIKTKKKTVKKALTNNSIPKLKTHSGGYCIRCTIQIPYVIEKPFCKQCYYKWAEWENYSYVEEVCHGCGEHKDTSMEKPVCYDCYRKFEKQTEK